ncbi:MAG: hypothetical protein AAGA24_06915 [Pseudomonadota bacterium]
MSLIGDGREAMRALLDAPEHFARIKDGDFAAAAVKLAKKQIIAAGQTKADLAAIRDLLGVKTFESSLDTLTAFQAKQLARRLVPSVSTETIASCNMALAFIRRELDGIDQPVAEPETIEPAASATVDQVEPPAPRTNKYLGRKAFRTGR